MHTPYPHNDQHLLPLAHKDVLELAHISHNGTADYIPSHREPYYFELELFEGMSYCYDIGTIVLAG